MRVVVFVKQVAYIYYPIAIESHGTDFDPEKMVYMLNPYDEMAMEAAAGIKEKFYGSEVLVVTAGPARSDKALRYALAFCGDKMIRINLEHMDPWTTAAALAQSVRGYKFDIILCGQKAIDTNDNLVGGFVAELLDIAQVSGVMRLEPQPDQRMVTVERNLGKGDREIIECQLPALFCMEKGANDPRYPSLPNRLRAEECEIELMEFDDAAFRLQGRKISCEPSDFGPPRPKPKKVFTPDSQLSAQERTRLIMSGRAGAKKMHLLAGGPEDLADKIADVLSKEGFI